MPFAGTALIKVAALTLVGSASLSTLSQASERSPRALCADRELAALTEIERQGAIWERSALQSEAEADELRQAASTLAAARRACASGKIAEGLTVLHGLSATLSREASTSVVGDCVMRKHTLWTELERRAALAEETEPSRDEAELMSRAGLRFGESHGACLRDVAAAEMILDDVAAMLARRQVSAE